MENFSKRQWWYPCKRYFFFSQRTFIKWRKRFIIRIYSLFFNCNICHFYGFFVWFVEIKWNEICLLNLNKLFWKITQNGAEQHFRLTWFAWRLTPTENDKCAKSTYCRFLPIPNYFFASSQHKCTSTYISGSDGWNT